MLVAHVEMDGVWRVEGGMHSLARALADLAQARGKGGFRRASWAIVNEIMAAAKT